MTSESTVAPPEILTYAYRPSLLGAPYEFRLDARGLGWSVGRKTGFALWRSIYRVRLSFRPASMQPHRFVTEVWAEGAPKLVIMSTSWKSMVEQERLDQSYASFVRALHRRLGEAQASTRFEQGTNPLLYWPGLAVFVIVAFALAALCVRALQAQAPGAAAFVAIFLALFLWRAGEFFRRNRPRRYRGDVLPAALMPNI